MSNHQQVLLMNRGSYSKDHEEVVDMPLTHY